MDIFKTDPMIGIFFLIVNILLITKFSFKNGVPTCDNYVFNVEALDKKRIKQVKITLPN